MKEPNMNTEPLTKEEMKARLREVASAMREEPIK
jgi:hypothetical protein